MTRMGTYEENHNSFLMSLANEIPLVNSLYTNAITEFFQIIYK